MTLESPYPANLLVNSFTAVVPAVAPVSFVIPATITRHTPKGPSVTPGPGDILSHKGIFDTGATSTAISSALAEKLELPVAGRYPMITASESMEANIHYVNILLPNKTILSPCRVLSAPLPGCDFLLGMDVISKGDVSIVPRLGFLVLTFTMYFRHGRIIQPPSSEPSNRVNG